MLTDFIIFFYLMHIISADIWKSDFISFWSFVIASQNLILLNIIYDREVKNMCAVGGPPDMGDPESFFPIEYNCLDFAATNSKEWASIPNVPLANHKMLSEENSLKLSFHMNHVQMHK
jgi:hypothetical protein